MTYYGNIREEELKLKVGEEFFAAYDRTAILGNVDFCVAAKTTAAAGQLTFDYDRESFLSAESKRGTAELLNGFVQLILTIGKARAFDRYLPPALLGAFDAEKIGFVPYSAVIDVFYQNDFNWNVTPSDHKTKEFQQFMDGVNHWIPFAVEVVEAQDAYVSHFLLDYMAGRCGLRSLNQAMPSWSFCRWSRRRLPTTTAHPSSSPLRRKRSLTRPARYGVITIASRTPTQTPASTKSASTSRGATVVAL